MTGNMTSEELQVIAFDIFLHSGNARTLIHEAFKLLRQGEKAKASQQLDKANEAILEAHKAQTNLLRVRIPLGLKCCSSTLKLSITSRRK